MRQQLWPYSNLETVPYRSCIIIDWIMDKWVSTRYLICYQKLYYLRKLTENEIIFTTLMLLKLLMVSLRISKDPKWSKDPSQGNTTNSINIVSQPFRVWGAPINNIVRKPLIQVLNLFSQHKMIRVFDFWGALQDRSGSTSGPFSIWCNCIFKLSPHKYENGWGRLAQTGEPSLHNFSPQWILVGFS